MIKISADLYIIFAGEPYEGYNSIGVFDSLNAAQNFYEHTVIEGDWHEYHFFDTLKAAELFYEQKEAEGYRGYCNYLPMRKPPNTEAECTINHERGTPAQIYDTCMHIDTIKDGQLVMCSHYCLLDKDAKSYGWKEVISA